MVKSFRSYILTLFEDKKMITSTPKSLLVLLALVLVTGVITAGCGQKKQGDWVNTASLPGHALDNINYANLPMAKNNGSGTVYLGDPNTPNVQFGPSDVSFSFRDLR